MKMDSCWRNDPRSDAKSDCEVDGSLSTPLSPWPRAQPHGIGRRRLLTKECLNRTGTYVTRVTGTDGRPAYHFRGLMSGVQKTFGVSTEFLTARKALPDRLWPNATHLQCPVGCMSNVYAALRGEWSRKVRWPLVWRALLVTSVLGCWPIDCTHQTQEWGVQAKTREGLRAP